jgi:hypothetical protein
MVTHRGCSQRDRAKRNPEAKEKTNSSRWVRWDAAENSDESEFSDITPKSLYSKINKAPIREPQLFALVTVCASDY